MDPEYGRCYARLYRNHWWWRARERVVERTLRAASLPTGCTILDFGCGDGLAFDLLGCFGRVRGIETEVALLTPGGPHRHLIDTEPLGSPAYLGRAYDLVTALDVLEHLAEPDRAVQNLTAMLRPGGLLLITVPALMSLWSGHDELNHHLRRYDRGRLLATVPDSLRVLQCRYLFPSLVLPKWLVARAESVRTSKSAAVTIAQHRLPPGWVNRALVLALTAEDRVFCALGAPFGASLLCLAQKRS